MKNKPINDKEAEFLARCWKELPYQPKYKKLSSAFRKYMEEYITERAEIMGIKLRKEIKA